MRYHTLKPRHLFALFLCILFVSCTPFRDAGFRAHYRDANQIAFANAGNPQKPFLKVHSAGGDVFIMGNQWEIDAGKEVVSGIGTHYNYNRRVVNEGLLEIPFDNIVLFETNRLPGNNEKSRIDGLRLLAGIDILLGVICLTVQKACFGSCPTFYYEADADTQFAHAEGFSNAIAPGLAYRDIDALNNARVHDGRFVMVMKNEAYETHNIKYANLLVWPKEDNVHVFHTPDDRFFKSKELLAPSRAQAEEGDITYLLAENDKNERFSLANPDNMASQEHIFLEFDLSDQNRHLKNSQLGLTVGFRQTLMTTYLIYHALDCMGNQVGDILAGISPDASSDVSIAHGIKKALGDIDVFIWHETDREWIFQGGFNETGPIAINHQMLPLSQLVTGDMLRVKLSLNRGLWRLDYVGLTQIVEEVLPLEISPVSLLKNNHEDTGLLNDLNDPETYLVSLPGDVFTLEYELPADQMQYDMFLAAKGFYLIWNREAWTEKKDLLSLYRMKNKPSRFLQKEAKAYKAYESIIEEAFWNSRINQQIITRHEQ